MSGLTSAATRNRFLTGLVATLIGVAFTTQLHAAPLNPLNFTSLGTLDLSNGTFVIDTDALTISETNASSTNLLFTGVMDNQGGQADSFGPGTNVTTIGSNGVPYIAVFTFDSISLASSAVISVTGHRALALLSQSTAEIDTTVALNGQDLTNTPGPGGFPGGDETTFDGQGPGGAGAAVAQTTIQGVAVGGSAGFGSAGIEGYPTGGGGITGGAAGSAYGDPSLSVLQGGSGGGSAEAPSSPFHLADGGGGGGALEIGAVDQLDLGANANIQARSEGAGTNAFVPIIQYYGGLGSGGGIVLFGQPVTVEGHADVTSHIPSGYILGVYNDGRIAVFGYQIPGITYFISGVTSPYIDTSHFSVGRGTLAVSGYGSFASSGWHTLVTSGHPLQLGSLSQITYYNDAGVNLYLENNANDITVWGGAEVTVPTNGVVFDGILELSGPTSQIAGSGALTNRGLITGSGQVQTVLVNDTGGRVSAIENTLVFAEAVTNEPGGKISAIDSTLDFNNGLDNLGALNLINTTVSGTVVNNGATSLAGTNVFTGVVSGAGNFSGTGTAQFSGTYSPGNSPAAVSFAGNVAFSPAATLHIELGGTNAGSQYDQLNVSNNITFGGALNVVLINSFVPAVGQVFHLINAGTTLGSFTTVNLPTLTGGLEWQNNLNADGTIAVIAPTDSGPQFGSVVLSGSGLIFAGTGGVTNGGFMVLSSTNVAAPLLDWIPVSTNPFDANGDFLLTNPINPARPQEFYRLELQ